jgi:hypothetical protein
MTGYGFVEIGVCRRCNMADFLFVVSDSDYAAQQSPRCIECHSYTQSEPIPRIPIMDETPLCDACGRPEFTDFDAILTSNRWDFIPAYLADRETQVTVHRACSTESHHSNSCEDCKIIYATTRNRDWRLLSPITNSQFVTLTQIEGDVRCDTCTSTYYEENGGEENFVSCPCCDDIFNRDSGSWYRDSIYCHPCYDNYVYECGECGIEQWDGDGHDCSEDDDESNNSIHSYSYRPSPYFFGKGQYYLGFELEVEARNESRYAGAEVAQDELGSHAYMKDDGSLNDGFEIVTHPHTLEQYQTNFNWEFIPKLKRQGFRSWNTETCGLHVHVSRTAFGAGLPLWNSPDRDQLILRKQAHELRFMKLIYDNQRQVERIAGRSGNHFATFGDKGKLVEKVKFGNQSNGRYSAINTENDATLEVRVFKGSLRKERVLSALEFVTASVEYTRDLKVTAKNQALTWLCFTAYVSNNMETYPNLALIMSESFASDTNNPNEN